MMNQEKDAKGKKTSSGFSAKYVAAAIGAVVYVGLFFVKGGDYKDPALVVGALVATGAMLGFIEAFKVCSIVFLKKSPNLGDLKEHRTVLAACVVAGVIFAAVTLVGAFKAAIPNTSDAATESETSTVINDNT